MNGFKIPALVLSGLIFLSTAAHAGNTNPWPVSITYEFNSYTATGTLTGARNAPGAHQYIGCWISVKTVPVKTVTAYCHAQESEFYGMYCSSTDPDIIATVRSITPASFITVTIGEKVDTCTSLSVGNSSAQLP
jgi:hypothetical protein